VKTGKKTKQPERVDPGRIRFVGIDPGLNGGIVSLGLAYDLPHRGDLDRGARLRFEVALAERAPTTMDSPRGGKDRKSLDSAAMLALVRRALVPGGMAFAALERYSTRPGESHIASATTGRGWGEWRMALVAASVPYVVANPQDWQQVVSPFAPPSPDPKVRSVGAERRVFGTSLNLLPGRCKKPHDGIADAAGLALFAFAMSAPSLFSTVVYGLAATDLALARDLPFVFPPTLVPAYSHAS